MTKDAETRRAAERERKARWRVANPERSRKIDRRSKRRQRARQREQPGLPAATLPRALLLVAMGL